MQVSLVFKHDEVINYCYRINIYLNRDAKRTNQDHSTRWQAKEGVSF